MADWPRGTVPADGSYEDRLAQIAAEAAPPLTAEQIALIRRAFAPVMAKMEGAVESAVPTGVVKPRTRRPATPDAAGFVHRDTRRAGSGNPMTPKGQGTGPAGDAPVLRVADVAQRLSADKQTVYRLIWAGQLAWINIGTSGRRPRIRVSEEQLARYLDARTVDPITAGRRR